MMLKSQTFFLIFRMPKHVFFIHVQISDAFPLIFRIPKHVFSSTPSSWQNGSAWARACVTHNANPKWIAPPYIVCMYAVKAWVTQIKHLIFTFRHEINQVHWLFLKNKIFTPQAPLHSLVMRDIDRYRHLISAGPIIIWYIIRRGIRICILWL